MIGMKSPSFAFNSVDVPGPNYRMWQWMVGRNGTTTAGLIDNILLANATAQRHTGNRLLNIIINAHGSPGYIGIGGRGSQGISMDTVGEFLRLKGKNLGTIWLVACRAAGLPNGMSLCTAIARNSSCQVIASDDYQDVGAWGTFRLMTSAMHNHIDEYEGNVYTFLPSGAMRLIDPHNDQGIQTVTDWEGTV